MIETIRRFFPWKQSYVIVYFFLSIAILGKLLLPGYVLTLDMVFTHNTQFDDVFYGWSEDQNGMVIDILNKTPRLPYYFAVYLLSFIFPIWVIQKLILFLIIFLSGVSAYQLCPAKRVHGKYFAGLLYMLNPFIYVRFLAGQPQLLLAYAITPFAVKAVIDVLDAATKKNIIKAALFISLVGVFKLHILLLVLLLFIIFLVVRAIQTRQDKASVLNLSRVTTLVAMVFVGLNLYWLIPAFTVEAALAHIGTLDITVFAPRPVSNLNIAFAIMSMYGFWRGGYTYVADLLPFWYLIFIFLFYLVVHGAVTTFRDVRLGPTTKAFVVAILVAAIGGIGAASTITAPVFNWLFEHFLIFRGFRDSQKFVALLVLSYAYLGGLGVDDFAEYLRDKRIKRALAVLLVISALISPPLYSCTMFGFHDQLIPMDYPRGWYEANEYLTTDSDDFNVLVFPWHMYIGYTWSERRITNPAAGFFDKPVIQGDNIEVGGIYSQSTHPVSKYIEFLLEQKGYRNFGELITPLNVKYVLLTKEVDYKKYDFLYEQEDLEIVLENDNLILFRNKHETAKIYAADYAYQIRDWNELIQLSREQDITNAVYLINDTEEPSQNFEHNEKCILNYSKKSPIEYVLKDAPTKRYLIFTASYSQDWRYGDKLPLKNMGVTNLFELDNSNGGRIYHSRFWIFLVGYVSSILVLLALLVMYRFKR